MSASKRAWLSFLPAALYMALIWVLSSMPLQISFEPVPYQDKGVHFVEYGVLAILLNKALRNNFRGASLRLTASYAAGGTVLWGLLDEIHQAYVPGRSSDAFDLLADTLGAAAGTLVYALAIRLLLARARRQGRNGGDAASPP